MTTGATMFSRSVGSALGVAFFGALVNARLAGGGGASDLERLSPDVLAPAIELTFTGTAVLAVLLVVTSALMPNRIDAERAA